MSDSLNRDEYSSAFHQLFSGDDDANAAYMSLWQKLVMYFHWKSVEDAEDLAQEVMERLFRKVSDSQTEITGDRVHAYAFAVARYVWLEHVRETRYKNIRQVPLPLDADCSDIREPQVDEREAHEREERLEILDDCLNELSSIDRDLLLQYYQFEKRNTEKLAADRSMSTNSLRVKVHRIRQGLLVRMKRKLGEHNMEVHRGNN